MDYRLIQGLLQGSSRLASGDDFHFRWGSSSIAARPSSKKPPGKFDVERGPVAGLLQRIRLVTAHQIIIIIIYAAAAIRDSLFPIHPEVIAVKPG